MSHIMNFIKSCLKFLGINQTPKITGGTYVVILLVVALIVILIHSYNLKRKRNNFLRCKIKY